MPVIDFPSNPSNNELFITQGKAMRYISNKNKWKQVTTLTQGQVTSLENRSVGVSSMSVSGNTLVIQKDDSSYANVSLASFAGNILTNYASASQLPMTNLVSGTQVYVTDTDSLFITDGSGWFKVATVNLSPSLSLGVSSISMSGGGTVDVNYTVNEPEDTPYTITASATSNATITVHQSNNTLSFVAGGSSTSETITITATDGVNTVADTLTMTVTVLSYSSYGVTPVYGQSSFTGDVYGNLEFGKTSNVSNNGLVATFGMPNYNGGRGGIAIFTNTSGDTSNNTSWQYLDYVDVNFASYANNGGSSGLTSYTDTHMGGHGHCLSADGSMIASHHNTRSQDYADTQATVIWERSGSSYSLHSAFNPWKLQTSPNQSDRTNLRQIGRRICCDATMTRIALPWPGKAGATVQTMTGRVDVFVRSGTTWTHEQTLTPFGNHRIWSDGIAIDQNSHISMSADGSRIMLTSRTGSSNGNGMMWIWHRSGTTWSNEKNAPSYNTYYYGTSSAMSGDGNHVIVTQPGGGNSSQQKMFYYYWTGTSWDTGSNMSPSHLLPNPDFAPQSDSWGDRCSLNYDGSMCTITSTTDDGYLNATGGSNTGAITTYKRYETIGATGNKPNNQAHFYYDKYIPMFATANYGNVGIGSVGGWTIEGDYTGTLSGDGKAIVAGSKNYNVGDEHLTGKGIIIQPT